VVSGFIAHIKGQKRHAIITQALSILKNLSHRGATGADPLQGDGAGILIQLPDRFLRRVCGAQRITLPAIGQYGVGMVFLPKEPASRMACVQEIERAIASEGQILLGWRDVPTNNAGLSLRTKEVEPVIRQVFIARGSPMDQDALERKLYIIRKKSGHAIQALKLRHGKEFYVPSMSTRTLVYKGMLLAHQVGEYYVDLSDDSMVSALAMVHQRFSTNTFPTWDLAHPFRLVCHNGEINTLRGNVNWIRARQQAIASTVLGDDLDKIWPLIYDGQSDSASFDNALELLLMGGYPLAHAMMLMIPEAWAGNPLMDEGPARILRIPRRADGAVGRTRGDGVHRRPPDRSDARPQRTQARALRRHRRRLHRDGLRSGRARHSRAQDHQEVAVAARERCCSSTCSRAGSSTTTS
jgi:glutamate synthase domain-containing protein 1